MDTQRPFDSAPEDQASLNTRTHTTTRLLAGIALVGLLVAVAAFATWQGIERSRHDELRSVITQAVRHGTVVRIAVDGMSCTGCADAVQQELRKVPGVADCVVDYDARVAEVRLADSTVTPDLLVATVERAGYRARLETR